jgi:hypothetical protein
VIALSPSLMAAGPFFCDGPITAAGRAKPTSRGFDFLPVSEPLSGEAGYLGLCSPVVQNRPGAVLLGRTFRRRTQSWMNFRIAPCAWVHPDEERRQSRSRRFLQCDTNRYVAELQEGK